VRAATLIKACGIGTHPYLAEKGFPEARALVMEEGSLVVPMRDCVSDSLVGAQVVRLVDNKWEKKMLPGMRAKGAALRIGNHRASETWLVEGYATGLSVDAALKLLRLSASVLVCFSAHNLVHVSGLIPGRRFVFADNDVSRAGETAAIATGLPYAMAPRPAGQKTMDANDCHQSEGVIAVAKLIMEARSR
jgi:putative DNA primase/helicase